MTRRWRETLTLSFAMLTAISTAAGSTWKIDPSHSTAAFSVRHLMIATVRGEFSKLAGTVELDDADPSRVRVDATIDASTIDTRVPERDEHLRSADFLDVEQHPTIAFRSTSAERLAAGRYRLAGDLTLRGVTKQVVLDVEGPTPEIRDPWGNVRVGASATTKIDRREFGVSWNEALETGGVLVGNEVSITIDVELVRQSIEAPVEQK